MKKYIAGFFVLTGHACVLQAASQDALELNVEDLLNVEVTSVSKKAQALNDSAAAIFVITNDDIKRTGATSIPEALRMAPGLDVARIDSNKWAVSSRGFNARFSNKLLVLIDGRNTYSRMFSGTYWENQDVMMEDVERIEVIRGPGATLWGANAVNGVINIITKHSSKTQGGLVAAGGGTEEQGFGAFRYGGKLGEDTTGRVYAKGFKRDQNTNAQGHGAGDDWDKVQGGFRIDSQLSSADELKFQGDLYHSHLNQVLSKPSILAPYSTTFRDKAEAYGGNIMGRWQHTFSTQSDMSLQLFYDYYRRNEEWMSEGRDTFDLDFQHRFGLFDSHELIWGLGYQLTSDRLESSTIFSMSPAHRKNQLFSAFVQDEMELIDQTLWLTLGNKFEHNDFTGFEGQPTARLMWAPALNHRLWAGVSRAVRTPSRGEANMRLTTAVVPPSSPFFIPVELALEGNTSLRSEDVIAYEVGYRTTMIKSVSVDVTAFYNDYAHMRDASQGAVYFDPIRGVLVQPLPFSNNLKAKTYGVEVSTVWQMLDWWRWDANYSLLKTEVPQTAMAVVGISPQQRMNLRSAVNIRPDLDFDVWFRYVGNNAAATASGNSYIPDYVTMDARLAWRPEPDLEISLVGQNLLTNSHLEYQQENLVLPTFIDRGMYGKISWNF
ncbi:TonB-dependent receptor [Methylomonas sp. Kb3]|uniref:TonB-dependent receptor plug domain-containing protein n=1 Tax=Methylomonas sp. Kb3 TaxID=1611544 RepID=UPI000C341EE4|nr:TonB-dependent receptor [Methylomonas sp. Kb3]PKD40416.1 TonB-dependent receptor [Methylomonas sp. Kb3]